MSNSLKTFKAYSKDFHNQSVNLPVVRASSFKSMQHIRKLKPKPKKSTGGHFDYGRQGTSTTYIYKNFKT